MITFSSSLYGSVAIRLMACDLKFEKMKKKKSKIGHSFVSIHQLQNDASKDYDTQGSKEVA